MNFSLVLRVLMLTEGEAPLDSGMSVQHEIVYLSLLNIPGKIGMQSMENAKGCVPGAYGHDRCREIICMPYNRNHGSSTEWML